MPLCIVISMFQMEHALSRSLSIFKSLRILVAGEEKNRIDVALIGLFVSHGVWEVANDVIDCPTNQQMYLQQIHSMQTSGEDVYFLKISTS